MNGKQNCRPGAPRQAPHGGNPKNTNNYDGSGHDSATPIVPFLPVARQAVAPTCPGCGGVLTVPYVATRDGLVHARCQTFPTFPRRDVAPSAPARRAALRSRIRGASAIVASLALEAQGDEARALTRVAYELARVAAGVKAVAQ